jgi:hypothetical protein
LSLATGGEPKDQRMALVSLVVVGHFNPMILHPEWFRRYKVLPEEEIIASLNERIVGEVAPGIQLLENPPTTVTPTRTQIRFSSYRLYVTPDRFELSAMKENVFSELPAVGIKIFSILSHTPTRAVGFNYEGHWKLQQPGQNILRRIFCADENNLSSIFGEEFEIGGRLIFYIHDSQVTFRVEKSVHLNDGVYINFNFHREIQSHEAIALIDKIRSDFTNDLDQAQAMALRLLGEPSEIWRVP